jgi:preprotein translocase subunit SecB
MKPSPIFLQDYFVTELNLSANPKFDAKQEVPIRLEDFQVGVEAQQGPDNKRAWQMVLRLTFQPPAEANVPYRFTLEIVGSFIVQDRIAEDRVERLIRVNGASMLYGALREIVRDTTARGPYSPILLPSTSFYEPQPQPPGTVESAAPGSRSVKQTLPPELPAEAPAQPSAPAAQVKRRHARSVKAGPAPRPAADKAKAQ